VTRQRAQLLRLRDSDEVGIALVDISSGVAVDDSLPVNSAIPHGHKFALHAISEGQAVRRNGHVIG